MSDLNDIRYTAAIAKCRGTYPHISDIADDVPIRTETDYWRKSAFSKPYHPDPLLHIYLNNRHHRPKSAPSRFSKVDHTGTSITSQYHESCQPKKPANVVDRPPLTQAELRKADVVSQDKIWKQSVGNEQKGLMKWENAYGYLTEYDSRGNPITKEALPESYEQFKSDGPVPITNSRHYGARIQTEQGSKMLQLEYQLSQNNKRKKLDSEMICY